MDKRIAGLLGAVAGLATVGSAQATSAPAPAAAPQASSYADLLAPVPNALAAWRAEDAAGSQQQSADELPVNAKVAEYHHHHHHHHAKRVVIIKKRHSRHHHHHHHHHHRSSVGLGVEINR